MGSSLWVLTDGLHVELSDRDLPPSPGDCLSSVSVRPLFLTGGIFQPLTYRSNLAASIVGAKEEGP